MTRMPQVAHLLWSTLVAAACGRVGFEPEERTAGGRANVAAEVALESRCGAALPAAVSVTISNDGGEDLAILSTDVTGGFTVITALPLTISPGTTAALDIRPPPAVIGTDRAGDLKTGMLTLTTDAMTTPTVEVALVSTVIGAELELVDLGGMPPTLDLMGASGACPSADLMLVNSGNVRADVTLSINGALQVGGVAGGLIDPTSSLAFTLGALTSDACAGTGMLGYTVTGDVCTETPVTLQATFTISGASSCSCN